jgi:spore coat protein U-like protein
MKFASLIFALCFLASTLASRPALAATATASFSVTATVVSSCQASTPATAFGANTAARVNAASPASVTCTSPTPYNVSLSAELAPSVTVTTRRTAGPASDSPGSALLPDSAHTGNWGRTASAGTVAGTARGPSQPRDGYGRTAWSQYVAPGAFADSVTVTVTY